MDAGWERHTQKNPIAAAVSETIASLCPGLKPVSRSCSDHILPTSLVRLFPPSKYPPVLMTHRLTDPTLRNRKNPSLPSASYVTGVALRVTDKLNSRSLTLTRARGTREITGVSCFVPPRYRSSRLLQRRHLRYVSVTLSGRPSLIP
jgi:hypothetical protein